MKFFFQLFYFFFILITVCVLSCNLGKEIFKTLYLLNQNTIKLLVVIGC